MGGRPESWAVTVADAGARRTVDGIWRLRLPLPWSQTPHVNAYVLPARGGGIVLVDCGGAGHPSAWAALERALEATGHGAGDVRELVLTHVHSDHMGLAARVHAASGCRLRAHGARDHVFGVAADPDGVLAARRATALRCGAPAERLDHYASVDDELVGIEWPVTIHEELRDGDEVETALGALRVVATPGHAPSHVCLVAPARGWGITADLVTAVFSPSFDNGFTPDPVGEWAASLRHVAALGLATALPGHGRPIERVEAVIAEHEAALAERLAACVEALAGGPATCHAVMTRLYPGDVATGRDIWRLPEVAAYLNHLVRGGAVAVDQGPDGVDVYALAKPFNQPLVRSGTVAP